MVFQASQYVYRVQSECGTIIYLQDNLYYYDNYSRVTNEQDFSREYLPGSFLVSLALG